MKEFTIEQKAKAYDEAIKVLHKYDGVNIMFSQSLKEEMFPELKELEDEKIRKAILGLVRQSSEILENKNQKQMIAWLEKQAEQKPDDKVEPKFKVGDWLCENEPNNYARFMQILEIVNVQGKERYGISRDIHNDKDIVEFDFVEKYYHKFDIQDANVGDVLVHNCCTFIFMGVKNGIVQAIEKYLLDGTNPVCFGEPDKYNDYHPATQKQRDALMKAIADDGYAFDFEKKELKKIERKFNIGDEINTANEEPLTITKINEKGYLSEDLFICSFDDADKWKLVEQKPAWNEEDDKNLEKTIWYVEKGGKLIFVKTDKLVSWLKSLKERFTWKPSDTEINILQGVIDGSFKPENVKVTLTNILGQLKKLREECYDVQNV